MIIGQHSVIRTAEPDDAYALMRLYDPQCPRSFLLGPHREVVVPTYDELLEVLARRDMVSGTFFIVENKKGDVRGCGVLRTARIEAEYAEVVVGLSDNLDYDSPLADEAMQFLRRLALVEKKLNKIVAHCLTIESAYRAFLLRQGFVSDGVQREILYTLGRYYDLESLSLCRPAEPVPIQGEPHESALTAS